MAQANEAVSMTAAEAVVRTLELNGIDTVFALPGVQNDYLFDALHGAQGAIRTLHTRHEQGAAYMALGAAMATGKPAAYAVVPGPGILNTTAALSTAYACNAPVLALTGQIPSTTIGRGLGMLHEIPDQLGTLRGLTKFAARIRSPQEAPGLVDEAFRQLLSGRPRPVALECPLDIWPKRGRVVLPAQPAVRVRDPIDSDAVEAAAKLLAEAERPLIVVGGGAQGAGAELVDDRRGAAGAGRGAPHGLGRARRAAQAQRQLPGSASPLGRGGCRARHRHAASASAHAMGHRREAQGVRIDADPEEIDRIARPAVAHRRRRRRRACARSSPRSPAHNRRRPSRMDEIARAQEPPPPRRSRSSSRRKSPGSTPSAPNCRRTASSSMS